MEHPSQEPKSEPYVGPRPFEGRAEDERRFFGREREAKQLLSLIITYPLVLLYSQSGAGKTSLLHARVAPLLVERRSQVLGTARVGGDLPREASLSQIRNIFLHNAFNSLQEGGPVVPAPEQTLPELLKARRPSPEPGRHLPTYRVLFFDQFEEIFTSHPERWGDRKGVFDEVATALKEDTQLRVVFALREEYLASLDSYLGIFPESLRTNFRLEGLRKEPALEAVEGPLAGTGRQFAPGAAEKLVKNLLQVAQSQVLGELVEPVQLQVVCQTLWRSLPPQVEVIDEGYIQDYGDVDQALTKYYDECVREVAARAGTGEGRLRNWFEKNLITPQGTRGIIFRDAQMAGGLPNREVDLLQNRHLIRTEMRGGAPWLELSHDRFIDPIRNSNRRWRKAQAATGQPSDRDRLQDFFDEAAAFLADMQGWSQDASPERHQAVVDAVLNWQLVFSSTGKAQRQLQFPVPLLPARMEMHADEDVHRWFHDRAYLQSTIRKINSLLARSDPSGRALFHMVPSSLEEMQEDWRTTALVFAAEVLEGRIHLTRGLRPRSYWRLEEEWLTEVKRTQAYLMWEKSLVERWEEPQSRNQDDYYFAVCRQMRERLVNPEVKGTAEEFTRVRKYLSHRYLDGHGRFAPDKPEAKKLLSHKAYRIYDMGAGRGADADWEHACTYARMFYDHIVTAVEERDEESTLVVLKAFQYSKAPEHRYLIINCFEAAIAIYFLSPEIVRGLWAQAELAGHQGSYTVTAVAVHGWPIFWTPPPAFQGRLSFDPGSSQVVLHGLLSEREKQELLAALPGQAQAIEELFAQSRLLPESTTL